MKAVGIILALLLAEGCASTPTISVPPGSAAPTEVTAAATTPSASATGSGLPTAATCPDALLDGRLEERNGELVAVNGANPTRLIWQPTQYRVRESGNMLIVEDASGEVVASEGDVVTLAGGFVGAHGEWLVCGGIAVRRPVEETTPLLTPAGATASPFAPNGELELVDYGFSTYMDVSDDGESSVSWAVIVENSSTDAQARYVDVVVRLSDNSGNPVQVVTAGWDPILPGQVVALGDEITVIVSGTLHTITAMDVEIVHNSRWEPSSGATGEFSLSRVRTVRNSIGGIRTTARLSSTFTDDAASEVVAVYRSAGKIIGGANTFVERVPSGGEIPIRLQGPQGLGHLDETELFAHLHPLPSPP